LSRPISGEADKLAELGCEINLILMVNPMIALSFFQWRQMIALSFFRHQDDMPAWASAAWLTQRGHVFVANAPYPFTLFRFPAKTGSEDKSMGSERAAKAWHDPGNKEGTK